jgi:hypothetical protein
MGKNIQKVKDMLDGNYKSKIQVGYGDQEIERREVGDKWTDSDGNEWEQKKGYRYKIPKTPAVGIFKGTCKDCEKGILKPWDKDVHKADGRCYHCQINYEMDLKFDKWIRWFAYRRLKDLQNMESLEKDMIQWVDELDKRNNEKIYDKTIANAIANSNVEMTINKNKSMTGG